MNLSFQLFNLFFCSSLRHSQKEFTVASLHMLANHRKRQQLQALMRSLKTIKTLQRTDVRLREMLEVGGTECYICHKLQPKNVSTECGVISLIIISWNSIYAIKHYLLWNLEPIKSFLLQIFRVCSFKVMWKIYYPVHEISSLLQKCCIIFNSYAVP